MFPTGDLILVTAPAGALDPPVKITPADLQITLPSTLRGTAGLQDLSPPAKGTSVTSRSLLWIETSLRLSQPNSSQLPEPLGTHT